MFSSFAGEKHCLSAMLYSGCVVVDTHNDLLPDVGLS